MFSRQSLFSRKAQGLIERQAIPRWLSYFREVGFCENKHSPERNLRDKKARLQESITDLQAGESDFMILEDRDLCPDAAECYQATCQQCMLGFMRKFVVCKEKASTQRLHGSD